MAEFLPLCDVLFNVISLAGYFCDVVFDVVMGYALLERGYKGTFAATISIVVTSLIISQILSLRWYLHVCTEGTEGRGRPPWLPVLLHCLQLGVLWRYAKLFVPVDLRNVKHEVRDLCMLRLVHAFCEAAPMLLLQLHILFRNTQESADPNELVQRDPTMDEPTANKAFAELNVISASLSLFSVCWALASFSKNVRLQNVHRLVLTWLGVIFQFLWRLGTISARICALTVYALVYNHWVFLVIGLHWVSMFLWLISPKNVFHGERISKPRKACLSALIAFVYVFAYINLQELNPRQKMVTFYCVMLVENCLLVGAWAAAGAGTAPSGRRQSPAMVTIFTLATFTTGLAFMLIYYRYFHVRRLGYILGEQQGTNSTSNSSHSKNGKPAIQADNPVIPGVFNCRFTNPVINNGGNARKKKKPTSFVPPPAAPAAAFWRRPLPLAHHHHGGSSENEGSSVGSRVNIQQKLQEKKQKQLAELRVIEEEIKQGKIAKTTPVPAEEIYSSLQRQPIPRAKTHGESPSWPSVEIPHSYQNYSIRPDVYTTYTEIFANNQPPNSNHQGLPKSYENPDVARTQRINYLNLPENSDYEVPKSKPRLPTIYDEHPRQNLDYNYHNSNQNMLYKSALQNALAIVQIDQIDSVRSNFSEDKYQDRLEFGYPVLPGKKLEPVRRLQRCRTPEILLAPHYLEGCSRQLCCHWREPYTSRKKEECDASSDAESHAERRDTPRPPSDIDSQISLPRSYTLPREFRYWRRRPRARDTHLPSNNSSDGDVDSADENESERQDSLPLEPGEKRPRRLAHRKQAKPETKL